jgi:hypothetical protein
MTHKNQKKLINLFFDCLLRAADFSPSLDVFLRRSRDKWFFCLGSKSLHTPFCERPKTTQRTLFLSFDYNLRYLNKFWGFLKI